MTKLLVLVSVILGFNVSAQAYSDFAVALGVRTNALDVTPSAFGSGGGNTGFQAGLLGFMDLAPALQLRAGLIYTQRVFTVTPPGGSEADLTYTYLDVPVGFRYMFTDYAGVFAGGVLALNVGKSANQGFSTDDVKSPAGYQFGVSFKFASQLGAELYYEAIPGTIQTPYSGVTLQNAKSVVANLLITFE